MSSKKFDTLVYIGRFEPFHNAHLQTIKNALELAHQVIIVIGSANQPRTIKNPFTVDERAKMIRKSLEQAWRVEFVAVEDNMYNDTLWASYIQSAVSPELVVTNGKIGIIGHEKDESSFYFKFFPQWEFVNQELHEQLSATDIRGLYFSEHANLNFLKGVVPLSTLDFLTDFKTTDEYQNLVNEKKFIDSYKKQYEQYPYPPVFVTVDCAIIQSGHILMIQRRSEPGKDLWALPGGFLNANTDRSIEDAMIRELQEETKIKVPEKVLRGNIRATKVFDAINRSSRGRTITHASIILLNDGEWNLPKIKASDDAKDAKWVPISELKLNEIYEDHFHIIKTMLGLI